MASGNHYVATAAATAGIITYPLCIPSMIQRATGLDYFHVPVYTSRLILQQVEYDSGSLVLLKPVGVVKSLLCNIPVRTRVSCNNSTAVVPDQFKSMCERVRESVMSLDQTHTLHAPWCIAILHSGSTVDNGPFTLVLPSAGPLVLRDDHVHTSLQQHMVASGILGDSIAGLTSIAANHITLLPAEGQGQEADDTDFDTRSYVRASHLVDNLLVHYRLDAVNGEAVLQHESVARLNSQLFSFHRLTAYDSQGLVGMRDSFRRLWERSFSIHQCYVIGRSSSSAHGVRDGAGSGATSGVAIGAASGSGEIIGAVCGGWGGGGREA